MDQPIKMNRLPRILFGPATSGSLGEICAEEGLTRVLVVCDGSLMRAGLFEEIFSGLEERKVEYQVADRVEPDPPYLLVDEQTASARDFKPEALIGIGGGSALDIAKGIAVLTGNEGSIVDFGGVGKVTRKGLPLILCPTTAGTGSEVTNVAVYSDQRHNKFGVVSPHNIADFAVLDPMLTLGLPPEQTALTGLDAMAHAMESYVGLFNSFLTEPYALAAMRYVSRYLEPAFENGKDLEAREYMLRASMLAGISFTNTQTGGAHACAMALGVATQLPHGMAVTLMLPAVMRFNAPAAKDRYAEVARILDPEGAPPDNKAAASHAAAAVEKLATKLGVHLGLRNYGVADNRVSEIAELAFKNQRIWINNPRKPSREDVKAIIRDAM